MADIVIVVDAAPISMTMSGATGARGETGATGAAGQDGADGADGLSAYEVAVANGFVGTEQEWLDSLASAGGVSIGLAAGLAIALS